MENPKDDLSPEVLKELADLDYQERQVLTVSTAPPTIKQKHLDTIKERKRQLLNRHKPPNSPK